MGRIAERALAIAEEKFVAGSGPGGQNVNKVATTVQLRVDVFQIGLDPDSYTRLKDIAGSKLTKAGELLISANEYRTQEQNREAARARLLSILESKEKIPYINKRGRHYYNFWRDSVTGGAVI